MRHFIIFPDYWKKPRERPCKPPVQLQDNICSCLSLLCVQLQPVLRRSVSFISKYVMLSEWMVMVVTNGNGDDDKSREMATVMEMAMVKVTCVCTRECESCARASAHARVRVR